MPRRSNADKLAALENELLSLKETNRLQKTLLDQQPQPAAAKSTAEGGPALTRDEIEKNRSQQAAFPPIAPVVDGDVPGSYKIVGYDAHGNAQRAKVPWTRATIEAAFGLITFVPTTNTPTTLRVLFDAVQYDLKPDVENTVPRCIFDIFMYAQRQVKFNPFPSLSMEEEFKNRTNATTNGVAMSRPFFIKAGPLGPED